MSYNQRLICGATAIFFALAAPISVGQAWHGVVSMKVSRIDTTGPNNYDFRIYGGGPMCGAGTPEWAYMNISWSNYNASAALLTTAYMAGKTVTVFSMRDDNGHCQIGYLAFQ